MRNSDKTLTEQVDELIAKGQFRWDRHGHLIAHASLDFPAREYDEFADRLWQRNQKLYEQNFGPVRQLHRARDFDRMLANWLKTDRAGKTVRGRALLSDRFRDLARSGVDRESLRWVYQPGDLAAIEAGFRVDLTRVKKVLTFVGDLILYEGEYSGCPFRPMAWEVELLGRAFGWVGHSDDWGREIRRFRKVIVFIPKKNGKSPLGAAVGTYLAFGDGEQGAKVFSAARDGKQAAIVHNHARQYVERLNTGQGRGNRIGCKVNKSNGEISQAASSSIYRILSTDNVLGQEGLNGSVIIDETHVVDSRLVKVLEYMGASRSEPMQFEISTTGDDPLNYGRAQFDYGSLVEAGSVIDHEVLFVGYGVFDEPSPEASCEEVWMLSNPSWFVTTKPTEFRAAHDRARSKGQSHYDDFQRYRLDRWLSGASPWLDRHRWAEQSRPFELEQFAGAEAVFGVDLSRTRDMSAAVLTLKANGQYWQKPFLWITERYLDQWRKRVPMWADWIAAGEVAECPGELINYDHIFETIEAAGLIVKLRGLVYDPTYSAALLRWAEKALKRVELIEFQQGSQTYEGRIDDYEAGIVEGEIVHDGNRCMAWQAGHTQTKQNLRGQRIIVKPHHKDDPRKIDGIVGGVMSHHGAVALQLREGPRRKRKVILA